MKKLMIVTAGVLLMVLALAAESTRAGPADNITVEESGSRFSAPLQVPEITASAASIAAEGAGTTFSAPLQEP